MTSSLRFVWPTLWAVACLLALSPAVAVAQGGPLQVLAPGVPGAPTVKLFGYSVDRHGSLLAVGAPGNLNFNSAAGPAGAVFVYQRQSNATWSFDVLVQAPTIVADDAFGFALEQTANQLIVGAPFSNSGGPNRGRVYAYTRQGAGYAAPQAIESGVPINNNARFGSSLSQDAGWLAVGAIAAGLGGQVQLFRYHSDFEIWVYHSAIDMPNPQNNSAFGHRVLLRGDRLLVSAPGESNASGFVYEYQRSGSGAAATWSQRQRFQPTGIFSTVWFGNGFDLSADASTLAIGGYGHQGSGRMYLFQRNGAGDWTQSGFFNDRPSIVSSLSYGFTTRFDGDYLFVSDIRARLSGSAHRPGNVYRLHRTAGPAFDLERDYARPGGTDDFYGQDLAVSGGELAIGAPGVEGTANSDEGRVYVHAGTGLNEAPALLFNQSLSLTQGEQTPAATVLGEVVDFESPSVTLAVTPVSGGSATGVSASALSISGTSLLGTIAASCSATAGTVRFQASDGLAVGIGDLAVNVATNPAPTLSYASVSVNEGSAVSVSPVTGPSDNGTVSTIAVLSTGGFSGSVSVDGVTGVVALSNASPAGSHTVTIRATDNCGATRDTAFTVQVIGNAPPVFTPGLAISRRQASPSGPAVAVGTVSDAETGAAALQVAAAGGGTASGVSIAAVSNDNGTVMAQLSANCTATSGTVRVQVSDGTSSVFGSIQVDVLPNTPPMLGNYPDRLYVEGDSDIVEPSQFLQDNGSLGTPMVEVAPNTYSGTSMVSPDGTVTLGNMGPPDIYTVGVQAVDDCGATTLRTFDILVLDTDLFKDGFE